MNRMTTTLAMLLCSALLGGACKPTEGVRCNPLLFEDECASGLQCTVPSGCVEAVCCPPSGASDDPGCQACGTDDMGQASNPD